MKLRKVLCFILAVIFVYLAIFPPMPAMAASSKEIQKQINQLKKEKDEIADKIQEVQAQREETQDEIADIVNRKNIIDQELQLLAEQISNIQQQIQAYNTLIADTQEELDELENEHAELQEKSRLRIRAMEENGEISYWQVLFKAESFADLLDQINMVEEIMTADKRMLKQLSDSAIKVEATKNILSAEKAGFEETHNELNAAEEAQVAKRNEAEELIQELLAKVDDLDALEEEFERQEQEFLAEIVKKQDEFNAAKHQEWLDYIATSTPPTTQPKPTTPSTNNSAPSNGSNTSGATWVKPCNYTSVTSPFGYRTSPTAGASTYHQGIDLDINTGDPIYATREGVVSFAGYGSAAGNWIKINHMDGFSSVYMHLDSISVSYGQIVSQGQMIGRGGNTGVSTGSHLHFGIMLNGTYVNPAQYIAF